MQELLLIVLLFFSLNSLSQSGPSDYSPVFLNSCDSSSIIPDLQWRLENSEGRIIYKTPWLIEHGKYRIRIDLEDDYYVFIEPYSLGSFYIDSLPVRKIHMKRADRTYLDTIIIHNLELNVCVCSPPSTQFFECGVPAEGNQKLHYPNGQLMVQGTFKDGYLQDTLFEYNLDGSLRKWTTYKKARFRFREFYPDGTIAKDSDPIKGVEITYYSNGQVKQEEYWRKRRLSRKTKFNSKSYYQDGTLKDYRTKRKNLRYDSDGHLTAKLKRSRDEKFYTLWTKLIHRYNYDYFKYDWTIYDTNSNVLLESNFSSDDFFTNYYPETLRDVLSSEYNSIVKYESGRAVLKIEYSHSLADGKMFNVFRKENDAWIFDRKVKSNELFDVLNN